MGVSTNGQLSYGVLLEEGVELPWDQDEEDIDGWWLNILDYKPPFEAYTDEGERLPEMTDEKISEYFAHRRKFIEENPLPVTVVNVCSCDYPMYMLAVPGKEYSAHRGYPEEINPDDMKVNPLDTKRLLEFCEQYGIEFEKGPGWFLSSLWC